MSRKNYKITAVIPVRSGSSRCVNKNTRTFGDTNLLKKKIQLLKTIDDIDTIVVNSSCNKMLKIAKDLKVNTIYRDPYYSRTETSGSDLYFCLSKDVTTEAMLLTHCVAPFVTKETFTNVIDIYRNDTEHSSVITTVAQQQYMFSDDGKSLNFDVSDQIPSQNLPKVHIPTFGCNIIDTVTAHRDMTIIGKRPLFYPVSQKEGIDIDTPFEFEMAECLYKNELSLYKK